MNLLEAVTRILRQNAILRGDTDAPASFSDTNHNASMQLAIMAIQDEVAYLVADKLIPYEKTSNTITLSSSTRTYSLDSTFVNFYGFPHFYDSTDNRFIPEYPGGQEQLQINDFKYLTGEGAPNWWYWEPTTTKKVGFYQVPDSTFNGRSLTYHFEAEIVLDDVSDTLPFHNTTESNTFCQTAGRRFKFMYEDTENKSDIQAILDNDVSYRTARATLLRLIRGTNAPGYWAPEYR